MANVIDDNGIAHYSNVPTDPRYKPMNVGRNKEGREFLFDSVIHLRSGIDKAGRNSSHGSFPRSQTGAINE